MFAYIKKYAEYLLLSLLMVIYVYVLGTLSIARHNAFASGYDLANADSTLWHTINGMFFQLSVNGKIISRMGLHADLILTLLSPIFLIWDNVRALILSESIVLALGAIPVYLLAKQILNKRSLGFVFVLLYLINPAMQWTDIYDFHGVSMAITFLLFCFYGAYTKKWRVFFIFMFLALITKEQISLSIAVLGVVLIFVFKERKIGIFTILVGIMWFFSTVFVIIPMFSESGKHWALAWYQFSSSEPSLGSSPLRYIVNKFIFAKDALPYYKNLLSPFGFLSLLGLPWLVLAMPELAVNMLSDHGQMRSIVLHYDSGITPWLIIAAIFGTSYLIKVLNKFSKNTRIMYAGVYGILFLVLIFAGRFNYHYSPLPTTPSCWCFMYEPTKEDIAFEELLQRIPVGASMTSSPEIRPHTTHRMEAYTLPYATSSADFIALIDQNRIVGNYEPKEFELVLRDQLNTSKDYSLVKRMGHFYLFKRNNAAFNL